LAAAVTYRLDVPARRFIVQPDPSRTRSEPYPPPLGADPGRFYRLGERL